MLRSCYIASSAVVNRSYLRLQFVLGRFMWLFDFLETIVQIFKTIKATKFKYTVLRNSKALARKCFLCTVAVDILVRFQCKLFVHINEFGVLNVVSSFCFLRFTLMNITISNLLRANALEDHSNVAMQPHFLFMASII